MKDVAGVYESAEITETIEGVRSFYYSTTWVLDLAESGIFTLKENKFGKYSPYKTYAPVPLVGWGVSGNWTVEQKNVILNWEKKVNNQIRSTIRDFSQCEVWASKDGREVRGRLNWKYAAHSEFDRYTKEPYIPIIRDDSGGINKTTLLYKQQVDADLWSEWEIYRDARLANLPLVSIKDNYVNENRHATLSISNQEDLILPKNDGSYIRLYKIIKGN